MCLQKLFEIVKLYEIAYSKSWSMVDSGSSRFQVKLFKFVKFKIKKEATI